MKGTLLIALEIVAGVRNGYEHWELFFPGEPRPESTPGKSVAYHRRRVVEYEVKKQACAWLAQALEGIPR